MTCWWGVRSGIRKCDGVQVVAHERINWTDAVDEQLFPAGELAKFTYGSGSLMVKVEHHQGVGDLPFEIGKCCSVRCTERVGNPLEETWYEMVERPEKRRRERELAGI